VTTEQLLDEQVHVPERLTETSVRRLVRDWHAALERHAPVEDVIKLLVPEGLVMFLYEGTHTGLDGFRSWYSEVARGFHRERFTPRSVKVLLHGPGSAEVDLIVNRQPSHGIWRTGVPPMSAYDEYQTWTVTLVAGTPRIRTYTLRCRTRPPQSRPGRQI
jgi:hypothetical protein